MQTSEHLQSTIYQRLGTIPPVLVPVLDNTQLLAQTWQHMVVADLDNPLSSTIRAKLNAYLARFCATPYDLLYQSHLLHQPGLTAQQLLSLLTAPLPTKSVVETRLQLFHTFPIASQQLSEMYDSLLEDIFVYCGVYLFLAQPHELHFQRELQHALGAKHYQHLNAYLSYLRSCHTWFNAYPGSSMTHEQAQHYLSKLIETVPAIADILQPQAQPHQRLTTAKNTSLQREHSSTALVHKPPSLAGTQQAQILASRHWPTQSATATEPLLVYCFDASGTLLPLEDMGLAAHGITTDVTTEHSIFDLFVGATDLRETITNVFAGGVARTTYKLDQELFDMWCVPVSRADGNVVQALGIAMNITAQKQAEAALRASEAHYRRLTADAPGVVFEYLFEQNDRAGSFRFVSESSRKHFGIAAEALTHNEQALINLVHPDDYQVMLARVAEAQHGLTTCVWEGRFILPYGEHRWFQGTMRPELQLNGTTLWRGMFVDITAQKHTEEALRQAKEEAERANRAKNDFLSRVSHELRTPMNAILGFAQILELDTESTPKQRTRVDHIMRAGEHLLELINEVLDISRIEAGTLTVTSEITRVDELIKEMTELIQPVANKRDLRLRVNFDSFKGLHVQANRQRLAQVLLNLLSNGVKYNREGGSLTIEGTREGLEQLRIRITDTGRGIAPSDVQRIFAPFERLGQETGSTEGTGLGLTLSRSLVELMGGTLGVESIIDQGSTFWIDLRICDTSYTVDPVNNADDPAQVAPQTSWKVLYIENNLEGLNLIEDVLSHWKQIRLLRAMQGSLGFELACSQHPDLVLLDADLPDLSIEDMLQRLGTHPDTYHIPVIVITADASEQQVEQYHQLGAYAHVCKPIDVRHLIATIQTATETGPTS